MTNLNAPNRDHQHGGLESVGIISQQIKGSMREGINWKSLALHPAAKEALDMIAHKIARVLSGSDPHDFQHWEDIAGYATAFMRTWSELTYEGDGEDDEEEDADVIKDEATEKSKINLNTCRIGQKLKLRDGSIVNYKGASERQGYPHVASHRLYTDEGKFYDDDEDYEWDVVEILPLEDEDDKEEVASQPVKDIAGRFPQVDVEFSGITSPDAHDSKVLAASIRSSVETAINKFKDCSGGFCPMPNVRQGPAVMFDPAD